MEQYFTSFFKLKEKEVKDYPPFENLHSTPQKALQQQISLQKESQLFK